MRGLKLTAAFAALMLLLSACSTVKLDDAAPVEDRAAKTEQPAVTQADTGNMGNADSRANSSANSANDPLNDPASLLAKRSIYFDLDSYTIKDEYKSLIEAHGKYLSGRTDRKIIIQGNTDERGGSEYNLALGQKRAEAVRRALALAGAKDSQMEAVSFGKEKPKATGSNEEAWAQNRRSDIAY